MVLQGIPDHMVTSLVSGPLSLVGITENLFQVLPSYLIEVFFSYMMELYVCSCSYAM